MVHAGYPIVGPTYVAGNPGSLDLAFASRCTRQVCANPTFSWWGAFLSDDLSPTVPWIPSVGPGSFRQLNFPRWHEIVVERR